MTAPVASVIVPVYNGAASIAECVASLLALRFPRERLDIVVVDNASTDRTAELLRGFGAEIRVLFEPTRGAAAARNHGIRAARGGLVAFTDADAAVDAGWLAALLPPLSDPAIGVVGGPVLARRPCNRIERFGETIHDQRAAIEESDPPYVDTVNWASRREVLLEVGLFDETLLRSQDVDLAWRIHAAGYRFVYAPDAKLFHRNERTPWGLFHEGWVHGFHIGRVRERHRTLLERRSRRGARLRARLAGDLRGVLRNPDRIHASLQLLFDLGKTAGELAGRARAAAVPPAARPPRAA